MLSENYLRVYNYLCDWNVENRKLYNNIKAKFFMDSENSFVFLLCLGDNSKHYVRCFQDIELLLKNGVYITNISFLKGYPVLMQTRIKDNFFSFIVSFVNQHMVKYIRFKLTDSIDVYLAKRALIKNYNLVEKNYGCSIIYGDDTLEVVSELPLIVKNSNLFNNILKFNYLKSLIGIYIDNLYIKQVVTLSNLFCGCSNLRHIEIKNFDTSSVIDMSSMFQQCISLESLSLDFLDTSKCKYFNDMFSYCVKLNKLDLSNFVMCNAISVDNMFRGCVNLKEINIKGWQLLSKEITHNCIISDCDNLNFIDQARISSLFYGR